MNRTIYFVSFVLWVFIVTCVSGRGFTRCDLARELLDQGFSKENLRDWICMIEAESERVTTRKEGPKKNGSYNWGLFQINDDEWCKKGYKGGHCKMRCSDFLLDDISKAAICARTIHKYYGFSVWDKYQEKCQYFLPELKNCGLKYYDYDSWED